MAAVGVAIPTRGRSGYLEVALASIAPQLTGADAVLWVILDGPDPESASVAAAHGAEVITLPVPRGLNVARNTAVAAARRADADTIIFCDDDVEAPPDWLAAYRTGIDSHPEHEAFGGPITAWLEGGGPRHCGAEPAPISTLDLGPADRDARHVWGANFAVRLSAIDRIGGFDEALNGRGDEEEWLDRLAAAGGRVRYLAGAGLLHRRTGPDAELARLVRAGYHLGRAARANDVRKHATPPLVRELRDLAGALWHTTARRCGYGVVFASHAAGRIAETLTPTPPRPEPGDFTSGHSGFVAGHRARALARARDAGADLRAMGVTRRAGRDAAFWSPPRQVQVIALERTDVPNLLDAAISELTASRHLVRVARGEAGDRGRFENLNRLLASPAGDPTGADWLIVIDDDVALPTGFLDRFLFLAERHSLTLAQPAHRRLSHAAWPVTRRRAGSVLRETGFVEIGPLVAFRADALPHLLPFPELKVGWGVDAHWAALAGEHGWRTGVIDATPISHMLRPIAASYDQSAARAESRTFLAAHAHITPAQADRTLHTHRSW